MGIKMNTYTGNQMTAEYDGIIQHRAITESGILHGCEISYMGANQVHIEKGYMMIMGRFCTVTEETIKVAMSSSSTEIPGRLYIHADLSDAQTPVKIMSVAASSLPSLEQDEDFNYTNGIYEIELATYTAGMTTIKDLQSTCPEISSGGGAGTIGENFSEQVSYSAGDYVIRKNTLYKFTSDHSAGAWNENHVTATTVTAELEEQNKNSGGLVFAQNESGAWGYKVGGADPVIPFKTGDVNAVHGFCWNQNDSSSATTVGLVNLSTNEAFKVESNSIVFLKNISKATLKLHAKLCGAGSYWTAYLDYALNSNWENIASNYNGNGLSSGTYWTVSKDISIPLTNIKAGDKIAFRSRTNKTSCRLISMTCVLDQS